jgi:hypothetical protein
VEKQPCPRQWERIDSLACQQPTIQGIAPNEAQIDRPIVTDRRTRLHRRCRDAALKGLNEQNIEVKFWSMYALMSLANCWQRGPGNDTLRTAVPTLRNIAAADHRLAPGYWWPMSAEAEDAIHCLESGCWPDPDAADRWLGNKERGSRDLC